MRSTAYAPSSTIYWQHGQSTERDFIYVTTQTLTHAQLQALSEAVGTERTLLVMCSACRGNADAFANLTIKKIPKTVQDKCEWDKDSYSLAVSNLGAPGTSLAADEEPVDAQPAAEPTVAEAGLVPGAPRRKRGRPPKMRPENPGQQTWWIGSRSTASPRPDMSRFCLAIDDRVALGSCVGAGTRRALAGCCSSIAEAKRSMPSG